ncbi:MAG: glycosyltransferase [Anaerolineae bacterium]|nr:glycosyltransferase [Anaerolineae bacterium]
MNVLLLTQILPYPPDAGPKIHMLNKIRYLARRHRITLVSFIRPGEEVYVAELAKVCEAVHTIPMRRSRLRDAWHLARSLLSGEPFLMARDYSPGMRKLVRSLVQTGDFDLLHVDQLNMAQFAQGLTGLPRILDEHNAVWQIPYRLYSTQPVGLRKAVFGLEWHKLQRYERGTCQDYDRVLVLSEQDRDALLPPGDEEGRFRIIPIAVDTREIEQIPCQGGTHTLISIGTMFYPPNAEGVLWFATQVYPLVKARIPGVTFTVVGHRPPPEVIRLSADDPSIRVTGSVPSVEPYVAESMLMVVPLLSGSGMRWKILQAFAWGIPVVSTRLGCEGFDVVDGEHLLVADSPESFAGAIIRALSDPQLATRLAHNARVFAERRHDVEVVYAALEEVYGDLIEERKR